MTVDRGPLVTRTRPVGLRPVVRVPGFRADPGDDSLERAFAYAAEPTRGDLDAWQDAILAEVGRAVTDADPLTAVATRVERWMYGWQAVTSSESFEGFRRGFAEAVVVRLRKDVTYVWQHLRPDSRGRSQILFVLILAGIALGERDEAETALRLLADHAPTELCDDGVHRARTSGDQLDAVRVLIGAMANATAAGLAIPRRLSDSASRACTFAMHLHRADGTMPALGDGIERDGRPLLRLASTMLGRGDLEWVATDGRSGRVPSVAVTTFASGGYLVWRSGWGTDRAFEHERWGLFDIGAVDATGDRGRSVPLGLTLANGRETLVVDRPADGQRVGVDGRLVGGAPSDPPTAVTVDGPDNVYRLASVAGVAAAGRPDRSTGRRARPRVAAALTYHATIDGLDLAIGSVTNHHLQVAHTRAVAFVGGEYWVVHDRLRAADPHCYTVRWYLPPNAAGCTSVRACGEQIVTWAPHVRIASPAWCGTTHVEDHNGASPDDRVAVPVVVTTVDGKADADIVTVINGSGVDVFGVHAIVDEDAVTIAVERHRRIDRVGWSTDGPPWFDVTLH